MPILKLNVSQIFDKNYPMKREMKILIEKSGCTNFARRGGNSLNFARGRFALGEKFFTLLAYFIKETRFWGKEKF